MQNNFVDTAQYQLLSMLHEAPQNELDQRLLESCKSGFKRNEFKPVSLPKPGDCVPAVGMKRGRPGPPITVRLVYTFCNGRWQRFRGHMFALMPPQIVLRAWPRIRQLCPLSLTGSQRAGTGEGEPQGEAGHGRDKSTSGAEPPNGAAAHAAVPLLPRPASRGAPL